MSKTHVDAVRSRSVADPPLVEIVIVAYRGRDLLDACLRSLADNPLTLGPMTVSVIDNASNDGTAELVSAKYPRVHLTCLEENAGFAAANNVALRRSTAPFVLLLNPDTEMRSGVLDHMVELMESREEVGMAGCRLVLRDGSFDHAAKRSFPTPLGAIAHFTRIGRRTAAPEALGQYRAVGLGEHEVGEVDAINGAFMLVRREVLNQVGLLDDEYWMYAEDLDWCCRAGQAGWSVLYDGRVTVLHVKSATAGKYRKLRQNYAFHRGMGRFYRRFQAGSRPALDVAVYLGIGLKFALSIVTSATNRALLSAKSNRAVSSQGPPQDSG